MLSNTAKGYMHSDLFWGIVNRNDFYFLILLFTSPHVSASTGHPQVKYTQSFFKSYYAYNDRLCGLVVRVPGYTTEMYGVSCEVRTEFIYVM
jgi:hypothetical protein